MTLVAAADGSALGNPGPAGWAWYVDDRCWASGGWPHGTNNMGELTAVLDLLQQTAGLEDDLLVYCDSTYTINAVTKWLPGWKRRGWKKGDGKPVANVEIIKELDRAMQGRKVRFEWVKGHSGHELNEAADKLANAAALAYQNGEEPPAGPGFGGARGDHAFEVTRPPEPEADLFSLAEEEPGDEDQVVALERSLLSDEVRSDPAAVAALLHAEWEEVGRSGRRRERAEMLAALGPLDDQVDLEVLGVDRLAADVLLLRWRSLPTAGEPALCSSVWVRDGGRWLQRYHQETPEA